MVLIVGSQRLERSGFIRPEHIACQQLRPPEADDPPVAVNLLLQDRLADQRAENLVPDADQAGRDSVIDRRNGCAGLQHRVGRHVGLRHEAMERLQPLGVE